MSYPPQGIVAGIGDMTKAVYDPDKDGKLALAQLVNAVCSEAEALNIAKSVVTKEFFVWVNETESILIATNGVLIANASETARFEKFIIPHDFTTLVEAVAIIQPAATSTQRFDLIATYGRIGETFNTHNEMDLDIDTAMTVDVMIEIDVSGVLTSLSPGDSVALVLMADATVNIPNCIVQCLRIKYS